MPYAAALRRTIATPSFVLGMACLALHLIANPHYGVFRDELYFIVCGEHPALGYVDQPPLIPWIAAASHALFGTALTPLRLAPALAMAATTALSARYAALLGGGRFAETLAGLAVLLAPVLLADGVLLSTDVLQPLTWLGCAWTLTRLAQSGDERWWAAFGAIVGVSLLSKYLIAFYVVALMIGVLATPLRRSLAQPWIYIGGAIALLIASPNLVWQASHGFPFLEIGRAGASGKNVQLTPLAFFAQQALFIGPLAAPIWIAGLWRFAAPGAEPKLRVFPIAYLVLAVVFIATHGKAYYLAPIYPTLLAAGAVSLDGWLKARFARAAALALVGLVGLATAPLVLPVLAPNQFVSYARALKIGASATKMERGADSALPQYFADMLGWPEMAAEVARVYHALPPDQQKEAVFFGRNYGEAAAIDIYGPALGAPPAISGHNNYYLWGPKGYSGSVMIVVGGDPSRYAAHYASVEVAGRVDTPYAIPYETDQPVYVLRGPNKTLDELWPLLRHYE